jgi:hypothetical protein
VAHLILILGAYSNWTQHCNTCGASDTRSLQQLNPTL